MATQIFNVNLVGYSKHIDDEKMLIATHGSTNARSSIANASETNNKETEVSPDSGLAMQNKQISPVKLGKNLSVIKEMTTD